MIKLLINGYMQDPIFKEYGIDAKEFWAENNQKQHDLCKRNILIYALILIHII